MYIKWCSFANNRSVHMEIWVSKRGKGDEKEEEPASSRANFRSLKYKLFVRNKQMEKRTKCALYKYVVHTMKVIIMDHVLINKMKTKTRFSVIDK